MLGRAWMIASWSASRTRYRPLDQVLWHIEHLVKAGFKDIRFLTPDSLANLSDDGEHPDYHKAPAFINKAVLLCYPMHGIRVPLSRWFRRSGGAGRVLRTLQGH